MLGIYSCRHPVCPGLRALPPTRRTQREGRPTQTLQGLLLISDGTPSSNTASNHQNGTARRRKQSRWPLFALNFVISKESVLRESRKFPTLCDKESETAHSHSGGGPRAQRLLSKPLTSNPTNCKESQAHAPRRASIVSALPPTCLFQGFWPFGDPGVSPASPCPPRPCAAAGSLEASSPEPTDGKLQTRRGCQAASCY